MRIKASQIAGVASKREWRAWNVAKHKISRSSKRDLMCTPKQARDVLRASVRILRAWTLPPLWVGDELVPNVAGRVVHLLELIGEPDLTHLEVGILVTAMINHRSA